MLYNPSISVTEPVNIVLHPFFIDQWGIERSFLDAMSMVAVRQIKPLTNEA